MDLKYLSGAEIIRTIENRRWAISKSRSCLFLRITSDLTLSHWWTVRINTTVAAILSLRLPAFSKTRPIQSSRETKRTDVTVVQECLTNCHFSAALCTKSLLRWVSKIHCLRRRYHKNNTNMLQWKTIVSRPAPWNNSACHLQLFYVRNLKQLCPCLKKRSISTDKSAMSPTRATRIPRKTYLHPSPRLWMKNQVPAY